MIEASWFSGRRDAQVALARGGSAVLESARAVRRFLAFTPAGDLHLPSPTQSKPGNEADVGRLRTRTGATNYSRLFRLCR